MQTTLIVAKSSKPSFRISKLNRNMFANILEYLSVEELANLVQGLKHQECGEFLRMAMLKLVFVGYFGKIDRSYYFSTYEEPTLAKLEMENIYYLSQE